MRESVMEKTRRRHWNGCGSTGPSQCRYLEYNQFFLKFRPPLLSCSKDHSAPWTQSNSLKFSSSLSTNFNLFSLSSKQITLFSMKNKETTTKSMKIIQNLSISKSIKKQSKANRKRPWSEITELSLRPISLRYSKRENRFRKLIWWSCCMVNWRIIGLI